MIQVSPTTWWPSERWLAEGGTWVVRLGVLSVCAAMRCDASRKVARRSRKEGSTIDGSSLNGQVASNLRKAGRFADEQPALTTSDTHQVCEPLQGGRSEICFGVFLNKISSDKPTAEGGAVHAYYVRVGRSRG